MILLKKIASIYQNSLYQRHQMQLLYVAATMHTLPTPQAKLVKVTKIPIQIIDQPQQLVGIARFATQSHNLPLLPCTCMTTRKKHFMVYRVFDEQEEEIRRGRAIELYDIAITTSAYKHKKFRLELPITRRLKSSKQNKSNELYFTFTFSSAAGTITMMNGHYEAKAEYEKREGELSYGERLEKQMARLDHRRREEIEVGGICLRSD